MSRRSQQAVREEADEEHPEALAVEEVVEAHLEDEEGSLAAEALLEAVQEVALARVRTEELHEEVDEASVVVDEARESSDRALSMFCKCGVLGIPTKGVRLTMP